MKKFFICIVVSAVSFTTVLAQGGLAEKYRSIQTIGHYQTSASPSFWVGENAEQTHHFNVEAGVGYQVKIGNSSFYFDTGAYLGYITGDFFCSSETGWDKFQSKSVRLKLPIYFDYAINVSNNVTLFPSFGLALAIESYDSTETYYDYGSPEEEKEHSLGFGIVLPHFGLDSIINNKFIVGLGWEYYLNTSSGISEIGSLTLKAGIVF